MTGYDTGQDFSGAANAPDILSGGGDTLETAEAVRNWLVHAGFGEAVVDHILSGSAMAADGGAGAGPAEGSADGGRHETAQREPSLTVLDHIEMGRVLSDWATGRAPRPTDVEDLRRQLSGIARVGSHIRELEIVQGGGDRLVLQLPAEASVAASMEAMDGPLPIADPVLPRFYHDIFHPGFGPVMSPIETYFARLGDTVTARAL